MPLTDLIDHFVNNKMFVSRTNKVLYGVHAKCKVLHIGCSSWMLCMVFYLIQHGLISSDGHLAAMKVFHELFERGIMAVTSSSSSSSRAATGGGGARVRLTESMAG